MKYKSDQEMLKEALEENKRLKERISEIVSSNRSKKQIIKSILFSLNANVKLNSLSIDTLLELEKAINDLKNGKEPREFMEIQKAVSNLRSMR